MDDNLTFKEWYEGLSTRERELMRRGTRLLLSRTFLIKSKDREMFGFFARNAEQMETYFAPMGYTMFLEKDYGVIMLRDRQEDKVESKDISAINKKVFTIRESVIYCALAWIFMEHMGDVMDRTVLIRPDELTRALEQFGIGAGYRTDFNKSQIADALKTLEKFSLIEVKGDLGDEDCVIVLYPTLMFGLDLKAMETLLGKKKESYMNYYAQPAGGPDDDNESTTPDDDSAESTGSEGIDE